MNSRKRQAFTLVELLVVITIIAMLIALLLPATQAALEAARRTQCSNQQRQISTAINTYATSKQRYPGSFSSPVSNEAYPWPWLATILPEMGQQNIYDQMAQTQPPDVSGFVSGAYLSMLICPTNPAVDTAGNYTSYCANMGRLDDTTGPAVLADIRANGIFHDRFRRRFGPNPPTPVARKVEDCDPAYVNKSDGSSNTILLGENLDATYWSVARGNSDVPAAANESDSGLMWDLIFDPNTGIVDNTATDNFLTGWMASQAPEEQPAPYTVWQTVGLGQPDNANLLELVQARAGAAPAALPSSFHPGVVIVTMADGSQRSLNTGIQVWVYACLMTPNGFESYPRQHARTGPPILGIPGEPDLNP
jgi:prepilin-type N-terminal cleavage/methylation domain-containing protein